MILYNEIQPLINCLESCGYCGEYIGHQITTEGGSFGNVVDKDLNYIGIDDKKGKYFYIRTNGIMSTIPTQGDSSCQIDFEINAPLTLVIQDPCSDLMKLVNNVLICFKNACFYPTIKVDKQQIIEQETKTKKYPCKMTLISVDFTVDACSPNCLIDCPCQDAVIV